MPDTLHAPILHSELVHLIQVLEVASAEIKNFNNTSLAEARVRVLEGRVQELEARAVTLYESRDDLSAALDAAKNEAAELREKVARLEKLVSAADDPDLFVGDSNDRAVLDAVAGVPVSVLNRWYACSIPMTGPVPTLARAELTRREHGTPAPTIIESQLRPLLEASQARVRELEAQLGIPTVVRNVKARCHSCGAELVTAAPEPDPYDAAVLEALTKARINEPRAGGAVFEDTHSEHRVCRAELARRRRPERVFESEFAAYELRRAELAKLYPGKYVLIKGDEFCGTFDTDEAAYDHGVRRFGNVPLYIKRVEPHA